MSLRYSWIPLGIAGAAYLIRSKWHRQATVTAYAIKKKYAVKQKRDQITLAWPNTGGPYQVYRDRQFIYSGMKPSVTDSQLAPGTIYTYTIERVNEQDHVLDRVKIQTATAAEEENGGENPLVDLVQTTVVAKGEIRLEWKPIDGIEEYTISRNGVDARKVSGCSFIDQNIRNDKEYLYHIQAKRPLQRSEQQNGEVKSFLASFVGVMKKNSSKEQTAMEEISVIKKVGPVQQLLQSGKEQQPEVKERSWQFRYTTFLAKKRIKNPNFVSKDHYFKGDNRGFDANSSRYRTRADVYIHEKEKESTVELSKAVGKTEAYSWHQTFIEEGQSSDEGIKLENVLKTDQKTTFQLIHSVSNPIVASPAIDYEVNVTFYRNGVIDIAGIHDQAPHHEVYLKKKSDSSWQTVHQAESKGLEMMADPMANQLWRFSTFTV